MADNFIWGEPFLRSEPEWACAYWLDTTATDERINVKQKRQDGLWYAATLTNKPFAGPFATLDEAKAAVEMLVLSGVISKEWVHETSN